jgi:hypothetical protein
MYGDKTNVEYEVCDYTGNNWSHPGGNNRFKEKEPFQEHHTLYGNYY